MALLRAVAAGERRAFDALYKDMRRPMLAYATRLLAGDRSAAEDAVDEAFLAIWRGRQDLSVIDNRGAWVRRIVRNKAVDHIRRQQSARHDPLVSAHEAMPDAAAGPEDAALSNDTARWLRRALSALSVEQREVVVLCYIEDRPLTDIAAMTGCPLGTVKTRLYHARLILRRALEAQTMEEA